MDIDVLVWRASHHHGNRWHSGPLPPYSLVVLKGWATCSTFQEPRRHLPDRTPLRRVCATLEMQKRGSDEAFAPAAGGWQCRTWDSAKAPLDLRFLKSRIFSLFRCLPPPDRSKAKSLPSLTFVSLTPSLEWHHFTLPDIPEPSRTHNWAPSVRSEPGTQANWVGSQGIGAPLCDDVETPLFPQCSKAAVSPLYQYLLYW